MESPFFIWSKKNKFLLMVMQFMYPSSVDDK